MRDKTGRSVHQHGAVQQSGQPGRHWREVGTGLITVVCFDVAMILSSLADEVEGLSEAKCVHDLTVYSLLLQELSFSRLALALL